MKMNGCNQSSIGIVVYWSFDKRGHLKKDCLKSKNEKCKKIWIKSKDDVAAIVNYNSNIVDYVLFVTEDLLFDG